MKSPNQQTLKEVISISGKGLFTGEKVTLRLCPAEAGTGIVFQRTDLTGRPLMKASFDYVTEAFRCTCLVKGEARVQTVEHLLSALTASNIDNVRIEVSGPEIPIGDGSSKLFMEALQEAGIEQSGFERKIERLDHVVTYQKDGALLIALPSDEYKIDYTLHYPHSEFIGSQYFSFCLEKTKYIQEIAPCRTFSLYEEIAPMLEKGLLKSANLANGVVIKGDQVLNPEGIRFPDEMVRHKILDLIGDLSLIGKPFFAHIIAIRSGHQSNVAFGRKLLDQFMRVQ